MVDGARAPLLAARWAALLVAGASHLLGAQGQEKVEVLLLAEAGCPFCQRAILGPLNEMVQTPGVADIINLVHHPFGNCYFSTPTCGGAPYSKDVRGCWSQMCVMVANPPPECFNGDLVPQHGPVEVQANRMEACALRHAATWQVYWVFLVCMERGYEAQGVQAAEGCAAESQINFPELNYCYNSIEGDEAMILQATTTNEHSEVPYIAVNGQQVKAEEVLAKVCATYTGDKPAACPNAWYPQQWQ